MPTSCQHGLLPFTCLYCEREDSDRSSEAGIRAQAQAFMERRERIATALMAGLLSNSNYESSPFRDFATDAVLAADALMARLDRDPSLEGK